VQKYFRILNLQKAFTNEKRAAGEFAKEITSERTDRSQVVTLYETMTQAKVIPRSENRQQSADDLLSARSFTHVLRCDVGTLHVIRMAMLSSSSESKPDF
jgi:hypothetical protein